MSDKKLEYLASIQEGQIAFEKLMAGAELVKRGGPEGIKEVVQSHPDLVLTVIDQLVLLLQQQREEHLSLVENYFEALDVIDRIIPEK